MKTDLTDITMVLDRSGSMDAVKDDTIGGVNTFLDAQRTAPGHATFTLHQFDDVFETPIPASDVKKAPNLTSKTFVPRGSTALFDAIGRAIGDTGSRLEKTSENDRAAKVVFVIVTDGQENASREFSESKIHEMIEHQKNVYSWEFVFIGANQDAIASAQGIGISADHAINYAANTIGTQAVFSAAASNIRAYRSSSGAGGQGLAWSAEQRDAQKKAGA